MQNLDQKAEEWRASVMVTLGRHGQKSTGMDYSLQEQGHGPREIRCEPGPAAHCLYWLEDPVTQQDLHKPHQGNVFHLGAADMCVLVRSFSSFLLQHTHSIES